MQSQLRLTEEERANLVAFVDGELDEEIAQKLEEKVTKSVSARKEVEALEKTWNMLDWLPRVEAPSDFASQTVSRIHSQKLRAEVLEGHVKQVSILVVKGVAWLACIVAAAGLGFAAVRYAWHDPSRELIEDLEIVENLDSYRAIPDIEFLNALSRFGIFAEPVAPAAEDSRPGETLENPSPAGQPPSGQASGK